VCILYCHISADFWQQCDTKRWFKSVAVIWWWQLVEWQNENNNNRDDDGDDDEDLEQQQELHVMVDESSSISEEPPVISLPGHTAPPINYEGPEFPVSELQPLPRSPPSEQNSEEMAARIKRTDLLQTQVVDWLACDVLLLILAAWDCCWIM